ncbi:hypothetical protein, conserved [Trypanosoma brucei gambiense DAL972]|uniref:Pre-rRNA-processing protein TSR2 n=1 Tax=Trypanosoma brucei gambiense (strain MHOM/CI/86/DAL972) TaxID=679716 RepID=D0A5W6_TRYB9|nr:hypothetical protein, conserved [Trypanosoma brucei gambiense DAL972]CBH17067.1 hypothetical protein, conserved [Trypanosoma brucei gambiense DAL972]|eukprot:XP_011779331.1 hypothetical protein, conserved [Trypanosoma brucei gambiense DAL972]
MQQQQQVPVGLQLMRQPYRATAEQFQRFIVGLDAVLNQWTALHLVSQHCDLSALTSMYRELVSWFQKDGEVYSDDLEIFFENFFGEARSVIVEDDSMKEVGDVLHDMYCRCCQNDFSTVERYVASLEVYRRVNPVQLSMNVGGADDGDELAGAGAMGNTYDGVVGSEEEEMETMGNGLDMKDEVEGSEQRKKRRSKKRKNAYERDADGWCVVRN